MRIIFNPSGNFVVVDEPKNNWIDLVCRDPQTVKQHEFRIQANKSQFDLDTVLAIRAQDSIDEFDTQTQRTIEALERMQFHMTEDLAFALGLANRLKNKRWQEFWK